MAMLGSAQEAIGEIAGFTSDSSGEHAAVHPGRTITTPRRSLSDDSAVGRQRKPRTHSRSLLRVSAVLVLAVESVGASAQSQSLPQVPRPAASLQAIGNDPHHAKPPSAESLKTAIAPDPQPPDFIIIGFVGGFVRRNDGKHREVQFAAQIRGRYAHVHAEVYGNHQRARALLQVLTLLDTNRDGVLSASEKQSARIILYGHSWGGSAAIALARELGKDGIPVLLTIQIDSINKLGQTDFLVPANVENAVNFYQTHGLLHGVSEIRAADPATTKIIGNFHMSYKGQRMRCSEYPWYSRMFTKPHIEIESDPRVWDDIGSLIDAELAQDKPNAPLPLPSPAGFAGSPGR